MANTGFLWSSLAVTGDAYRNLAHAHVLPYNDDNLRTLLHLVSNVQCIKHFLLLY